MGPPDGKRDISRCEGAHWVEQGQFGLMIFGSLLSAIAVRNLLRMYCARALIKRKKEEDIAWGGKKRSLCHNCMFNHLV